MDRTFTFTKAKLDSLPLPAAGQRTTYHDDKQPGLQLRVTSNGVKTFNVFRRVAGGQPERVTLGHYPSTTIEQARAKARDAINKLAGGKSTSAARKAAKAEKQAQAAVPTLAEAIAEYVETARRSSDDLPLKERTKSDYLAMVKSSTVKRTGRQTLPGVLYPLAGKRLSAITADDLREVHDKALQRGRRPADYGLTVLRAVLNFFEVPIPENLFAKTTSRRKRIHLLPVPAAGECVHLEDVGRWWAALETMDSEGVRYIQFLMLTGCRVSEPLGIKIEHVDSTRRWVTLVDTKNRTDHILVLSDQAWAIVEKQAAGKAPGDKLFHVPEAWKTVAAIRQETGIHFHCKMLRSTFASVADPLMSGSTLKRLMNHKQKGDVTDAHYIQKNEQQLRAGWQAVADWLDEQAAIARGENVVRLAVPA